MKWNNWLLVFFGLWLIVSPWLLGFSDFNIASWNVVFIGSLVAILAFWNFDSKK